MDDRLLIEELLVGLDRGRSQSALFTTSYWYYRACRAAVVGAGGHLSGPFEQLAAEEQEQAILSLLELREDVGLPDPRATVPVMVDIARRHTQLNLLNLEAAASASVLDAEVWLSEQAAKGVLPSVLDAEGTRWKAVAVP
ncbi:MAG: hypothetical protein ACT4PW_02280 [Acidimicrobiia bacterium]